MSFPTFILLGSFCWAVETDVLGVKCGNIYEYEKSSHTSLQRCLDRAEYLGTQIQLNLKKRGSYATEMSIYCIPSDNSRAHGVVWK
jgi:hypothetical protein